jgi:hypothetical protein
MHMGMMDTGIPVIISTEQKGILQFNPLNAELNPIC